VGTNSLALMGCQEWVLQLACFVLLVWVIARFGLVGSLAVSSMYEPISFA